MSKIMELGKKVVEMNREGKGAEVVKTLCSPELVSIEAAPGGNGERETRGTEGVLKKHEWWTANHEIHNVEVRGPYANDNRFCVIYKMDVTFKPENRRTQMEEVATYTVENDKIVREEFYYAV